MKINYLKFIALMSSVLCINMFNNETISQENSAYTESLNQKMIHNTSTLSDNELYEIAKKINDDALPGESDYAQILLTEAIRKNPKNVNALLEAARTIDTQSLLPLDKLQKKFEFIYQAFLIEPHNPKVRYKFADILLALDQKDYFQKVYSQTIQEFPDNIETQIEKIQILAKTDPKNAVELSEVTLKNGGNILEFLPAFLVALKNTDKEENFSKNLLSFSEKYPNGWLSYHLGLEYMHEKKFENAEAAFKKSILLGNEIMGRLQLAIVQYQNKNKIPESIANLRLVIQQLKKNRFVSDNILYFAHIQLARALMASENSQETLKELKFISKYSFHNHAYFIYLVNEYLKNGHQNILIEPMKIAIENDPLFPAPYIVLSNIFKKQKNEKLYKEFYEKFIILNTQNSNTKSIEITNK